MTLRSSLLLTSLLATVPFVAPAIAAPAAWSKASMTEAASYFPAGSSTMVVAVGTDAHPAARTLIASLQTSTALELVADASAIGDVDAMSDPEILKRAFRQAVDRVAIVRVFPTSDSVKAVVTVYAISGDVTSAFTLAPGRALATNPTPVKAEDGVRRDQLSGVTNGLTATEGTDEDEESGEITYKTNAMIGVTAAGLMAMDHVTFYKDGRAIRDTPAFYEAIGEKEKARLFREQESSANSRRRWGFAFATAGVLGLTTFGTFALIGAADPEGDATTSTVLTGASLVALIGGYYLAASVTPPEQITGDEGIQLAKRYNKKRRDQPTASTLRFAPSASPTGGGVVFGGSF